ncbi:MAG: family 78 glycoside hydrolase catalytic domain [Eubacteriales bacterium]|nr:family 78 glycoside hydrolase catalytic domain [Eubacteriales bacterium]
MRINNIKINGMTNPIGYDFDTLSITYSVSDYSVEEAKALHSVFEVIISDKEDFSKVLFSHKSNIPEKIETTLKMEPRTRYYVGVSVDGDKVVNPSWFETGKCNEPWSAKWISTQENDTFHPIFRKQYYSTEDIKKARLYICGLGLYEAYINGNRVGNEYLSPGLYDYSTELQYQTFDVTSYMGRTNDIQILLGKGWYMGRFGLEGKDRLFGNRFQVLAELHIEFESGKTTVISTDEEYSYYGSDIEESGIYDGEIYNHCLYKKKENDEKKAILIDEKRPVIARVGVPVVEKETIPVKEIIHTPKRETVLDFGQNMAGYVSFKSKVPEGTKIVLKFGEVLQNDCFYNDNYRTAKSTFEYVSGGFEEDVWPHFTFFGFRYVCVEGWHGEINPEDFIAHVIYSDLERTGYFHCSNEKINKLYQNAFWGQCSNFIDMPTDCPQRDERMGWTGDAQVFATAASFNMDTRIFYQKFLHDLRNEQRKLSGGIPNYIPSMGTLAGCCFVWGDAGTFIPDTLSKMYDNQSDYQNYYELMKDWCEYCLQIHLKEDHLVHGAFGFGDWLALDGVTEQSMRGGTNDDYISSVYLCTSLCKTSKMAYTLGKVEDGRKYADLSEEIKEAILNEYFTASGHLCVDTQAAYLIALRFGIYRDIEVLKADLTKRFKRDGYRIRCGFVGAPVLCQILAENGMEKEAYHWLPSRTVLRGGYMK